MVQVTGSYSYVDPTGALITVTYTAGVMGYTETRERQEGYLDISSRSAPASSSASSASRRVTSSSSSSSSSGVGAAANRFSSSSAGGSQQTTTTLLKKKTVDQVRLGTGQVVFV